ncbi:MAG: hypothetical protein HRT38_07245 [Alteromonadaceae bacterium]|nr:hypothetical protein [Alteromonadaceae bacterium]
MHVNNLASANNSLHKVNSQVQAGNTFARVQQEQAVKALKPTQSETQNSKSLNAEKQANAVERFDVDEKAIALVENELNGSGSFPINDRVGLKVNKLSDQAQPAVYDQPSQQNKIAVAAYQSVGNLAQRDSIHQIFGVDLFV